MARARCRAHCGGRWQHRRHTRHCAGARRPCAAGATGPCLAAQRRRLRRPRRGAALSARRHAAAARGRSPHSRSLGCRPRLGAFRCAHRGPSPVVACGGPPDELALALERHRHGRPGPLRAAPRVRIARRICAAALDGRHRAEPAPEPRGPARLPARTCGHRRAALGPARLLAHRAADVAAARGLGAGRGRRAPGTALRLRPARQRGGGGAGQGAGARPGQDPAHAGARRGGGCPRTTRFCLADAGHRARRQHGRAHAVVRARCGPPLLPRAASSARRVALANPHPRAIWPPMPPSCSRTSPAPPTGRS